MNTESNVEMKEDFDMAVVRSGFNLTTEVEIPIFIPATHAEITLGNVPDRVCR